MTLNKNLTRCTGCKNPAGYCAEYVGSLFRESHRRILFIGLDAGQSDNYESDAETWRDSIVEQYRTNQTPWNHHYRACIAATANLLGLPCTKCNQKCLKLAHDVCALLHFAQGNAVRCVASENKTMEFRQKHMIADCLRLIFDEAAEMHPDVIVLQSPQLKKHFYSLLYKHSQVADETEHSAVITWNNSGKKSIVVTTYAPAAFRFFGTWKEFVEDHLLGRLKTVHQWFGESDPTQQ